MPSDLELLFLIKLEVKFITTVLTVTMEVGPEFVVRMDLGLELPIAMVCTSTKYILSYLGHSCLN